MILDQKHCWALEVPELLQKTVGGDESRAPFIRGRRVSVIAVHAIGRRRGSGRDGRRSNDIGRQRRASRTGTVKADAIGSASKAGKHRSQRQLTTPPRVVITEQFFRPFV